MMKIELAEHYGLCFGVRDALQTAADLAESGPLTVLGDIVHNPAAIAALAERGTLRGDLDNLASATTSHVLITAHGASQERRQAWAGAGYRVTDTTCPLVRRAHRQLGQLVATGYLPVVIGQPGHAEVRGLVGDFPQAWVLGSEEDARSAPAADRYGVISQTTQPPDKVARLLAALRAARPEAEVRYCDTICQPTKDRQLALRQLMERVDAIIVIGGHGSNNTRQLVATAQAAGRPAYQVERPEEIQAAWLRGVDRLGVTAGTSTLPATVAAVCAELLRLSEQFQVDPHP